MVVVREAKRAGESPWVGRAARIGLAAKGVLYAVVGLLAIQIPLGLGGETKDREGALQTIAQQPFGRVLLVLLTLAFAAYAAWRFVQAFLDREDEGTDVKGLAKRAGYLGRGVIFAALCVSTVALLAGSGGGGSNERRDTARLFELPLGRWIVGAIGLGFVAAGLFNAYRAVTKKFREDLEQHKIADAARPWVTPVGVVGHTARGVVFALIGVFFVRAAIQYDSKEAIGLDGALRKLAQAPYGSWLLGLVAAGLLAYALFAFVEARYRDV